MGRHNKKYQRSLHEQVYDRLTAMQRFGESKREAIADETEKGKIFSKQTYETYKRHCRYFASWVQKNHPECRTLKKARRYVNDFLEERSAAVKDDGSPRYSAWTIQMEAAALNKLYGIDKADPDRFQPPKRRREDIRRSRISVKNDKHFSVTNNAELIAFCKTTGCRRNVLERLEGRDLWTREQMVREVSDLRARNGLPEKLQKHLRTLEEALSVFPEDQYFLHHRKDKGGRYRYAPLRGSVREVQDVIDRMKETAPHEKVWKHVHKGADIHGYRSAYAVRVYKDAARDIKDIPYDKVNRGSGRRYQSEVYTCRVDEHTKYDKRALLKVSKSLGHTRLDVGPKHYLRGI